MKSYLILILSILFLNSSSQSIKIKTIDEFGIDYVDNKSFEKIFRKAKKENKMVFVNCYNPKMPACLKNDSNHITAQMVGAFYNKNFISVLYNVEENKSSAFTKKYNRSSRSVLLYLNSKGERVHQAFPGCSGKTEYLNEAKLAVSPDSSLLAITQKIENGEMSYFLVHTFLSHSFNVDKEAYVDKYMDSVTEEEKTNKESWELIRRFTTESHKCKYFKFVLDNEDEFRMNVPAIEVDNYIISCICYYFDLLGETFTDYPVKIKQEFAELKKLNHPVINKAFVQLDFKAAMSDYKKNKGNSNYWNNLIEAGTKMCQLDSPRYRELLSGAWFIYQNYKEMDDSNSLMLAKEMVEKSIVTDKNLYNLNIYAMILAQLGDKNKAIEYEEEAIKLAKVANKRELVIEYEQRLIDLKK